jgi:DNA repair exonuclease SbcCD ATPase subunit
MSVKDSEWIRERLERALQGEDPVLKAIAELKEQQAARLTELDRAIQAAVKRWSQRAEAIDRDISLIEERLDNLEAHVGISGDFEPAE